MVAEEDRGQGEPTDEWFLEQLEAEQPDVKALMAAVRAKRVTPDGEKSAWGWAELLADKLAECNEREALLDLLAEMTEQAADPGAVEPLCRDLLERTLATRHEKERLVQAGFDSELPLPEKLRRLRTLLALVPGALCQEKTWGFGVVAGVDDFYGRATIHFDRKRGHEMTLAYAAECLQMIGPDHLMAQRHADPEGMAARVQQQPAEIVRMALRSYGDMNVAALQTLLTESLVPADQWKAFWDGARKELKRDRQVAVPARRSEPIRLLTHAQRYDAAWFAALARTTDLDEIHAALSELWTEQPDSLQDEAACRVVEERLTFAIVGAPSRPGLRARLAALGLRLQLETWWRQSGVAEIFLDPPVFQAALEAVPLRDLRALLPALYRLDPDRGLTRMLDVLPEASIRLCAELAEFLLQQEQGEVWADRLRSLALSGEMPAPILLWLAKHVDQMEAWRILSMRDLLFSAVACLCRRATGETLQAQNRMRALMESRAWLERVLGALSARERREWLGRVHAASAWDLVSRRSALGEAIRLYPELATTVAEQAKPAPAKRARVTSMRSYRERTRQYQRLLSEDIPANTRDIAVARSYGDLRENAEYESAKQQQGLLMKRKGDLDRDLSEVKQTDFSEFASDCAGMGTQVELGLETGERRVYTILGEWDRDETLNIISSESRLAQVLDGRRVGDEVDLPDGDGERHARLVSVQPLSERVREWIAAEPDSGV